MSDATTTSRNARENLARALNALQSDPNVPPQLMELAAPVAQAMGALHNIEKTGQLAPHADVALNHVRTALQSLQQQPANHPAVAQAMEAVASSLGLVHNLWKMAQPQQAQVAAQAAYAATAVAPAPPMPPMGPRSVPRPAQPVAAGAPIPPPPAFVQQPAAAAAPAFPVQPPAPPPPVQAAPPPPPPPPPVQVAPPPPPPPQYQPPPPAPPQYQAAPNFGPPAGSSGTNSRAPGSPVGGGDLPLINADLGTHSPTNFYKGLSGNDIIDHGGLFVSTYMIPKIGAPVRLHVSLPGGYEFEANAVVAWSREASDSSNDAPPGFGARFTAITPEARQLVYRYVRNREPLFHDDL